MVLYYGFNIALILAMLAMTAMLFFVNVVPYEEIEDIYIRYRTKGLKKRITKLNNKRKEKLNENGKNK